MKETNEWFAWLKSLSWSQLQVATEFDVDVDEYSIWKDLVRGEVPPPKPIHPASGRQASAERFICHINTDVRRTRARKMHPRLFQLVRQSSGSRKLGVVARRFPSADGDCLTVGATRDQQVADKELVDSLSFVRLPGSAGIFGYLNLLNVDEMDVAQCLRRLRIASRGNFGRLGSPARKVTGGIAVSAWLDPSDRWFSLPFFVASRVEVALWSTFQATRTKPALTSRWDASPWKGVEKMLSKSAIDQAMCAATARVINDELFRGDMETLPLTRDTIIFSLLSEPRTIELIISDHDGLSELLQLSLLQLNTVVDQFKVWLVDAIRPRLSLAVERSLLGDLDADLSSSNKTTRKKKLFKKSAKKRKKLNKKRQAVARAIPTSVPEGEELDNNSDHSFDDNYSLQESARIFSTIPFPDNDVSARERNRNMMISLAVLDDVLEEVHEKVGLPSSEAPALLDDEESVQLNVGGDESRSGLLLEKIDDDKEGGMVAATSVSEGINDTVISEPDLADTGEISNFQSQSESFWVEDQAANFSTRGNGVPVHKVGTGLFAAHYETFSGGFVHRSEPIDYEWEVNGYSFDNWVRGPQFANRGRDRSIMHDFFVNDQVESQSRSEMAMASSTAASIASSTEINAVDVEEDASISNEKEPPRSKVTQGRKPLLFAADPPSEGESETEVYSVEGQALKRKDSLRSEEHDKEASTVSVLSSEKEEQLLHGRRDTRSPSPSIPATPPPILSPILVSLADLSEIRKDSVPVIRISSTRSFSSVTAASVPNSPRTLSPTERITPSRSRENLRSGCDLKTSKSGPKKKSPKSNEGSSIASSLPPTALHPTSRDDNEIRSKDNLRRFNERTPSFKSVVAARAPKFRDDHDIKHRKSTSTLNASHRGNGRSYMEPNGHRRSTEFMRPLVHLSFGPTMDKGRESCAQSEVAADAHEDFHNWNDSRRSSQLQDEMDNGTTKDETTTITSAPSHREPEAMVNLREERDAYRDLCLTMGAEIAKLRNMIATQRGLVTMPPPIDYHPNMPPPMSVLPSSVSFENVPRAQTLAAMSDTGYRGEHESLASEDDALSRQRGSKHLSSSGTALGSELSIKNSAVQQVNKTIGVSLTRDFYDPISANGMQSRLSRDILQFLEVTRVQLQRQDSKRMKALERIDRLVKTVWPRARVELYGSHITGLCLPSSDLDLAICLPNVHMRAPALAPGALEGRNAVNESSQKVLARKLKSESWIDPRSIKIIERTAVPVIKVSTKDTRAKTLQLDISFDGPGHYGLAAIDMISATIDTLPMIRPLVLTLKQFLIDRGLLTVYTGGLSSYCLFLMVTRYLQEQESWGDCGSLLMGFLDFYGNHFDPRTTGISVRCRQYFSRPHLSSAPLYPGACPSSDPNQSTNANSRRNSFGVFVPGSEPSRRAGTQFPGASESTEQQSLDQIAYEQSLSYALDPFLVEDPLSPENNVGRNSFRIFQILRAFSDAHRAMQAALEWDMNSGGDELGNEGEYPLLKCLFQNEDQVYDM